MIGWAFGLGCVFLILIFACAYVTWRDRENRGMRIKAGEVEREKITITLPNFCMRDFKDRGVTKP